MGSPFGKIALHLHGSLFALEVQREGRSVRNLKDDRSREGRDVKGVLGFALQQNQDDRAFPCGEGEFASYVPGVYGEVLPLDADFSPQPSQGEVA